jgi:alcohol dehydrogenase class IV
MTAGTVTTLAGRFVYPRSTEVIYGPGEIAQLSDVVERHGARRVFTIASSTLVRDGIGDRLAELLGARMAGIHSGVAQHVPRESVLAAADAARAADADLLLSVGGGTPIDCAKAVALCIAGGIDEPRQFDDFHIRFTYPDRIERPPMPEGLLPHVSVPTTLSGSEHTNLFGVTDQHRHVKHLFSGAAFVPDAVILDAEIALETPDALWGSSAVRAIDHAVEGTLSRRHVPFMDALALESLRILRERLIPSLGNEGRLEARADCLLAAWLAIYGLTNVGTGLSHAIGHQLAAEFGMLHGVTSAVMLPEVLRFNAPVVGPRLERLGEVLGASPGVGADGGNGMIDALGDFIAELEPFGVPHTLSAAGATRDQLPAVAGRVLGDMGAAVNPRPVSHADLMALFDAAW